MVRTRGFGRLGWDVSEIGYGMWGLAGWTGADQEGTQAALERAVALGCNFFDTAFAYGDGLSERILGALVRAHPERKLYVATKIAPKNRRWPARPEFRLDDVYPPDYVRAAIEQSLENLGTGRIDLLQLHVWDDSWATGPDGDRWHRALDDAKREGLIGGIGISVNRWEPTNVVRAIDSGVVDAVQVIYNIFDQNPEDVLLPLCRARGVAVIARVPFDEGTLTGTLTKESRWPDGDWRNSYFVKENLEPSVERADRLKPLCPPGMTMPEMALRFILTNPDVATVIPGMRWVPHVEANLAASDGRGLPPALHAALRAHRWDRTPTAWSQ